MAAGDPARLIALAEAVADGSAIDWARETDALPGHDRELLGHLRLLAGVAEVHRAEATAMDAQADTVTGRRTWGSLEIRGRLGAGRFGTVYRAWDARLDREVALKLLDRPRAEAGPAVTVEEGRLLARVRHPHVITVFGADEIDGRVGLWMELVRGSTLEAIFNSHGRFSAGEAALIGADLCGAVAAVHHEGLVHRDVKAQNVMREAGGRIVLMDFGAGEALASRSRDGRVLGTPLYMAPELFTGARATPASDIYSLGVLLFWLVSGVFPVPGRTLADVQAAIDRGERRRLRDERPELPAAFVAVVERALAPNPANRYASGGEFEHALRRFVGGSDATSSVDTGAMALSGRSRSRRLGVWLLAGAVMIPAAAGIVWRVNANASARSGAPLVGVRSVAVLPFSNVSSNPDDEYFAAGLGELLVTRLASIKSLQVLSNRPAARPDASLTAGPAIVADLKLDGVITGSVDRRGSDLRVNIRLLQAQTNALLWSESYERPVEEAFALQGLIARDIAREFRVALSDDERTRLNQAYRPQPHAQDAYLRARVLMHRQQRSALVEARQLLERAIEIDPGYQLAQAALARCYVALQEAGELSPADGAALARTAASRALAIDDNAEAQLALAHVSFVYDWNWAEAEAAFQRSLELQPSFSDARNRFSRFLVAARRTQEALEQARLGLQLDPLSLEVHEAHAMALFYDRQYSRALDTILATSSLGDPSPTILGRIYGAMGDHAAALRYTGIAYARRNSTALLAELGRLEAIGGRRDRAEAIVAELRQQRAAGAGYVFPGDIAFVLIALGSTEEALDWLELAVEERAARTLWLGVDPRIDAVRSHPRVRDLLRSIGP